MEPSRDLNVEPALSRSHNSSRAEPLVRSALASAQEQNMPGQSSAIKRTTERKIYPAHGDPIRVVPLNVPQELIGDKAAPTVAPQLTYRNGPLIRNVEIFTVFWGTGWQQAPASSLITQINGFFD